MGKNAILSAWVARREAGGAVVPQHFVRRLVVVVDGLDETRAEPGENPLPRFLPHVVPAGIRFLCATRPTYPHLNWLEARSPVRRLDLDDPRWTASNEPVVRGFWKAAASEYEPPLSGETMAAAIAPGGPSSRRGRVRGGTGTAGRWERCPEPALARDLADLARVLARESHWIRDDPKGTPGLLWNRLRRWGWTAEDLDTRIAIPGEAELLRVRRAVSRESTSLVRTLDGHTGWVRACAVTPGA
jgi:hypothetical protein